jgi:flagellar assembly factor FliW
MTVTEMPTTTTPHLFFDAGLVGFAEAQRFELADAGGGAFELRSLDDAALGFVVVEPGPFFPDYAPVIDDVTADRLDLRDASEALLLLIVTLGRLPEEATANLLAPVVANQRTRQAVQVVLNGQPYPLRAPLLDR